MELGKEVILRPMELQVQGQLNSEDPGPGSPQPAQSLYQSVCVSFQAEYTHL